MSKEEIKIVIPHGMIPREDLRAELIEIGLRLIAQKFEDKENCVEKYGIEIDNNVFSMHPYCWCEEEECEYCQGINPSPNFLHKESGLSVHWYKYIGRSMEISGNVNVEKILDIIRECLKSCK